jgi:hypothetical protein
LDSLYFQELVKIVEIKIKIGFASFAVLFIVQGMLMVIWHNIMIKQNIKLHLVFLMDLFGVIYVMIISQQ